MPELPDDKIEEAAAETAGDDHRHETVVPEDGTLLEHLGETHDLDVPPGVSSSTQDGLHDRLHQTEKARDD